MKKNLVLLSFAIVVGAAVFLVLKTDLINSAIKNTGLNGGTQEAKVITQMLDSSAAELGITALRNEKRMVEGCPGKTGCAEGIYDPKYVSARNTGYMNNDDLVIGVAESGFVEAFPVKIMNWRQLVTAEIAGKPVIVTYSPLTASAAVYSALQDKKSLKFRVSSKLLNNNAVLYEENTKSYFNQYDGIGLTGTMTGRKLDAQNFDLVTWKDWQSRYPKTIVLALPKDNINYDEFPFEDYRESPAVYFPLEHNDNRLPVKEIVFGVEIDKKAKAYSESELAKEFSGGAGSFTDMIGEKSIKLVFKDGVLKITDQKTGAGIVPKISYFFAWAAFHPDTEILKSGDLQTVTQATT